MFKNALIWFLKIIGEKNKFTIMHKTTGEVPKFHLRNLGVKASK